MLNSRLSAVLGLKHKRKNTQYTPLSLFDCTHIHIQIHIYTGVHACYPL